MLTFILSLSCFVFFGLLHAVLYRLKWVGLSAHTLGGLCLAGILPYGLVFLSQPFRNFFLASESLPLPWTSVLIYFSLCLIYTGQCAAVENPSPSMTILDRLIRHPEKKVSRDMLTDAFSNEKMIKPRLFDLVQFGHAAYDGQFFTLTKRGHRIISLIRAYRKLIKRDLGG